MIFLLILFLSTVAVIDKHTLTLFIYLLGKVSNDMIFENNVIRLLSIISVGLIRSNPLTLTTLSRPTDTGEFNELGIIITVHFLLFR